MRFRRGITKSRCEYYPTAAICLPGTRYTPDFFTVGPPFTRKFSPHTQAYCHQVDDTEVQVILDFCYELRKEPYPEVQEKLDILEEVCETTSESFHSLYPRSSS